jgi:coproporphyrinogen III oxidase
MKDTTPLRRERVKAYLLQLQDSICKGLEVSDGKASFAEDAWSHESGGGGRSRVIVHGNVFEKGGVNFSAVEGELPVFLKSRVAEGSTHFFATGVSIVIHPYNPLVPIVHMNVRYFETNTGDCWFGGGIDLTPIYINPEEARFFHGLMKASCDAVDASFYPKYRDWADEYFFNQHRKETRGIGGIFYDYLRPNEQHDFESLFTLMQSVGNTFLKAYVPLVEANKNKTFTELQKQWQLIRRGRYVEFNLVYDRGTRFGLETGGRIESILMSLPEHASWIYNHTPADGSEEANTLALLRKGVNWLDQV